MMDGLKRRQPPWVNELADRRGWIENCSRYFHDSCGAEIPGELFRADAVDSCAVPQSDGWQERLFEIGDGTADRIVQGTRGVLRFGAENESRADTGSSGLQHGEPWGGGGLCGETVWHQGQDFSVGELQSGEAWPHFEAGCGDCGERRQRPGVCVSPSRGICQAARCAFPERRN